MRKYNAESPKQDRKRFNSIVKTIHISYLPIIYLYGVGGCEGGGGEKDRDKKTS